MEKEVGLGRLRGVVLVEGAGLGAGFDEDGLVVGLVGRRFRAGGGEVEEEEEEADEDESLVSSSSELLLLSSSFEVSPWQEELSTSESVRYSTMRTSSWTTPAGDAWKLVRSS